jgi:hypothetical protein
VSVVFGQKLTRQTLAGGIFDVEIAEIGDEEFRVSTTLAIKDFEDDFVGVVKARRQPGNGFPDPLQGQSHLADWFFFDMIASG